MVHSSTNHNEDSNQAQNLLIPLPPALNESKDSDPDVIESSQPAPTSRQRAKALVLYSDSDNESNNGDVENSDEEYQPNKRTFEASCDDSEEQTGEKGKLLCNHYRLTIMPLTHILPFFRKIKEI